MKDATVPYCALLCPLFSLMFCAGNVPFSKTSEDDLREIFREFGEVENVRIVRDRVTGKGKGFAYVQYKSADSVEAAVTASRSQKAIKIKVEDKSFELRVQKSMKPVQKREYERHRKFVKKGGKKGLQKRTKRWRNRKQKRHELKTGSRKRSSEPREGTSKPMTRDQRKHAEWKDKRKRSDTVLMTKGQRKAHRVRQDQSQKHSQN
mmetsp:Transcript_7098/g.11180  ORF Transcript_7098/g.11180 Transcript_7098/m.11180 type:complete len:206 (-) Transcript_7098:119-736(-)